MHLRTGLLLGLATLGALACKTGPDLQDGIAAELTSEELAISEQSLTDLTARAVFGLRAPPGATVSAAHLELWLDGRPLATSDTAPSAARSPEGLTQVIETLQGHYADSAEDIAALERKGALTALVRGTLTVALDGRTRTLTVQRAQELRAPRLLRISVKDVNAARYDNGELSIVFHLSVRNPNAFPLRLRGVRYQLELAGETLSDDTVGQAERVEPSSEAVFELQEFIDRSQAALGRKLLKLGAVPYKLSGELAQEVYATRFTLSGTLKLQPSH